ncbi:Cytochrome P450 family protein [Ceratobasidium theobromae]|uniref:Cytochrome P450 family protein n=1 Tax=Ceratobasidium theobromae TaxID=1582974 RepID=A0A5N5QM28_9AGAM|nr:Cytochrome P450 family protein [Ceratobasidium theobromae]
MIRFCMSFIMDVLPNAPISVALSCTALWALFRFFQMISKGYKYGAHQHILVSEEALWRNFFPGKIHIPGIIYGNNRPFCAKYSEFRRAGKDAYMQIAMTNLRPNVYLADPRAIKAVAVQKQRYMKDVETVAHAIGMYGPNMAGVEGEDWKRHRKANQRAFNEKNIQLVWAETEDIMKHLFEIWDQQGADETCVDDLALLVISTAAFGQRLSWNPADDIIPQGRQMSFQRALRTVSTNLTMRLIVPSWATGLTEKTRTMATAFSEFGVYLNEMVTARRKGTEVDNSPMQDAPQAQSAPDSLFNALLSASDEDSAKGEKTLDDREVTGNVFVFLFAGHETTAHTLAFSLGLLALYPEIQEEVYQEIKGTLGPRDRLEYADINDIKLVACTFWETLRMYPIVNQIPKVAMEDSVVSVARNGPGADENTREDFFIPKGANVWFSIVAAHYNPTYWPEPEKFRPRRFLEPHDKDAFLAFSVGPRSCLGRKFAETEGIAALAMTLARYEIKIDEKKFPTIPGETRLAREARLLNPAQFVTLTPTGFPLIFKRR